MRQIAGRLSRTTLAVKLALLALLLSVPISSVAAARYGAVGHEISMAARERRGVAFLRRSSLLLESVGSVRLELRPGPRGAAIVTIAPRDRIAISRRLSTLERMSAELRDLGVDGDATAPARAAWRRYEASPSLPLLAAFGKAVLKANSVVTDASRLSFEPHVIEGNLGDALSTENGVILQSLSVASITAEAGALRRSVTVLERIALGAYLGSADAAAANLAVDRAGAASPGAALDGGLAAGWDAAQRASEAVRAPLELVVSGDRSGALAAPVFAARRQQLVSASHRFVALLDRQLNVLFDARLADLRRLQLLVIFATLLTTLVTGGAVALMGRVVVRRDRRELLHAQQQSRTLSAELAQQRAEKALSMTQAQFSAIFERSNMGIALLDASGETIEANARLREMLAGAEVIPPHDAAFAQLIEGATPTYHCERSLERSGAQQWLEMTVSLVATPEPAPVTAIAMLRDITERKAMDEHMRYATMHDELTSLANRTQFVACLERELEKASAGGTSFAVLFIDLDEFKLVNDALGHHAGDQVLSVTARRIAAASRDIDVVARFHGDEFAVLLCEIAGELAAEAAAERIRSELIAPMSIEGKLVVVSSSIGIVMANDGDASAEQLLRRADAAMYLTKSRGRSTELGPRHTGRLTSVSSIAS